MYEWLVSCSANCLKLNTPITFIQSKNGIREEDDYLRPRYKSSVISFTLGKTWREWRGTNEWHWLTSFWHAFCTLCVRDSLMAVGQVTTVQLMGFLLRETVRKHECMLRNVGFKSLKKMGYLYMIHVHIKSLHTLNRFM